MTAEIWVSVSDISKRVDINEVVVRRYRLIMFIDLESCFCLKALLEAGFWSVAV